MRFENPDNLEVDLTHYNGSLGFLSSDDDLKADGVLHFYPAENGESQLGIESDENPSTVDYLVKHHGEPITKEALRSALKENPGDGTFMANCELVIPSDGSTADLGNNVVGSGFKIPQIQVTEQVLTEEGLEGRESVDGSVAAARETTHKQIEGALPGVLVGAVAAAIAAAAWGQRQRRRANRAEQSQAQAEINLNEERRAHETTKAELANMTDLHIHAKNRLKGAQHFAAKKIGELEAREKEALEWVERLVRKAEEGKKDLERTFAFALKLILEIKNLDEELGKHKRALGRYRAHKAEMIEGLENRLKQALEGQASAEDRAVQAEGESRLHQYNFSKAVNVIRILRNHTKKLESHLRHAELAERLARSAVRANSDREFILFSRAYNEMVEKEAAMGRVLAELDGMGSTPGDDPRRLKLEQRLEELSRKRDALVEKAISSIPRRVRDTYRSQLVREIEAELLEEQAPLARASADELELLMSGLTEDPEDFNKKVQNLTGEAPENDELRKSA